MRLFDWPVPRPKWRGPIWTGVAVLLFVAQCWLFMSAEMISLWLVFGGLGFLLFGIQAWIDYASNPAAAERRWKGEELPTADEYEQWFNQADTQSDDQERPHA